LTAGAREACCPLDCKKPLAEGFGEMKDTDAAAVGRAPEPETFTNRKLIRPTLPREHGRSEQPRGDQGAERRERPSMRKSAPPDVTHAENFYYQKQMQSKTPMVVVLHDGEQVHGVIEWYDKCSIKLNRAGGQSNLLIYKSCIKYMFKESEGPGNGNARR
jgi:host factor-I protein